MREQKSLTLSKYSQFYAIILMSCLGFTKSVQAETLDAGFVMTKMSPEGRASYLSGVVEGLAFSRFLRDRPDQNGMNCIYAWQAEHLAGDTTNLGNVYTWLERHPDKTVGVLLYTLIKRECGE